MNNLLLALLLSASAMLFSQSLMALEQGDAVPKCALTSMDGGQSYKLEQFKGKVLYVDFWASWCGPCAKSFPFLNQLDAEFKDKGLQILGVNLDEEKPAAHEFLNKYPAAFTVVADAGEQCARSFDVKGMPSSYLVDKNGMIHHVHLGFRPAEAEELRGLVEQLLLDKPAGH